jgi:predicted Zn finger-like uncharacterized protein
MSAEASDPLRYVFIERTRCPACRSAKLRTQHTQTAADGSVTRSIKCQRCGHNFYGILEADLDSDDTEKLGNVLEGIQLLDKPPEPVAKLPTS